MPSSVRSLVTILCLGLVLANCSKWKVDPYDLVPQVQTGAAVPATTSVQVEAKVTELGPNTLQEFGIVFSPTNQQPTTADTKVPATGTSGTASVTLSSLEAGKIYYYRTYAINNKGITGYGEVKTFTTAVAVPNVQTLGQVGASGATSIQLSCQVTNASTVTLKEYGIVYSTTSPKPSAANAQDSRVKAATTDGSSTTITLSNLLPNTTYYCRAYAISTTDVLGEGEVLTIKTGEPAPAPETLDPVGAASTTAVQVQCRVNNASAITLKEYGIVYSDKNQKPDAADNGIVKAPGSTTTATVSLTGLQPNTPYTYWAFATNGAGSTAYGAPKSFTTTALPVAQKPVVETVDAVAITSAKANLVLRIKSAPTPLDKYGICFSKTNNDPKPDNGSSVMPNRDPAYELNKDYAFGTDVYSLPLEPNTTYFYRAYVVTVAVSGKTETGLGEVKQFKTTSAAFTWNRLNDFKGAARAGSNAFVIGNKAYIMGGDLAAESLSDEVWEYNAQADSWTKKANLPVKGIGGASFVIDGLGYLMGLFTNNNTILSELLVYSPTEDKWTRRADALMNRSFCTACVLGKKAYIGVGFTKDAAGKTIDQTSLLEYNAETGKSATIPLAGTGTRLTAVRTPMMVSYDNKCVIGGGTIILNDVTPTYPTTTIEFNPAATTKYEAKADMPQPRINTGVNIGNRAFAVSIDDNKVFEYKNGQWVSVLSPQSPLPPTRLGRTLFAIGNTIYVAFGRSGEVRSQDVWALTVE